MARTVALAVDLGASGGRVVSGAFDGRLLELAELHRFENAPVRMGGTLVWDLVRLWNEILGGLRLAEGQGRYWLPQRPPRPLATPSRRLKGASWLHPHR